jgi:hypothetical protein
LIVPLRVPARGKIFAPLSVVLVVGFAAWIAATLSWQSIVFGGGGIVALVGVWGLMRDVRKARGGAPAQIVATEKGISSPMWSISWDRVARVWIGRSGQQTGNIRVLNIEPFDLSDIERPRSFFYSANLALGRLMGIPPIQIPQMNVDRPLETLLSQLEEKARGKLPPGYDFGSVDRQLQVAEEPGRHDRGRSGF